MGVHTHLCPKCGDHRDYVCVVCRGCETCCTCQAGNVSRFLSSQSREAQHIIHHAVNEVRQRNEQLDKARTEKSAKAPPRE